MPSYYENDHKIIAVDHQPASLIDLALARDVNSHHLLRGTGLFYERLNEHAYISPLQMVCMLDNACTSISNGDTCFQLGTRFFPGHYGNVSTVLANASCLENALNCLRQYRQIFCPVFTPRVQLDQHYVYVYWLDCAGVGKRHRQWVETMMTALTSFCFWQSGERWPWRYIFSYPALKSLEHYHSHLGSDLHFEGHIDAMVLPRRYWQRNWPRAAPTVAIRAQQQLEKSPLPFPSCSLIETTYQRLFEQVQHPPSLEAIAGFFGISPATFKRKLASHGMGYQALLDDVRKHVALYLYWTHGSSSEAVALHLGFHDTTNFRRSFKRWTGILPSSLKQLLPQF